VSDKKEKVIVSAANKGFGDGYKGSPSLDHASNPVSINPKSACGPVKDFTSTSLFGVIGMNPDTIHQKNQIIKCKEGTLHIYIP